MGRHEESLQPPCLHFRTLTARLLGTRPAKSPDRTPALLTPPTCGGLTHKTPAGVSGLVLERCHCFAMNKTAKQEGYCVSTMSFSDASEASTKSRKEKQSAPVSQGVGMQPPGGAVS